MPDAGDLADPSGITAWNGVTLRHPTHWEVSRLDRDQIQWQDGKRTVFEVRWALHRGRYDAHRAFKRFCRQARRKGLPRPEPWSLPPSWRSALSALRVTGFSWRRSDAGGRGLLAYCPHCRRQSLLLIHPHLAARADRIPPLLDGFSDHPKAGENRLDLYGVRACLPPDARLLAFRFDAGRYRLHWRHAGLRIELLRWAPAGILLQRQSLAAFAASQWGLAPQQLAPDHQGGFEAVAVDEALRRKRPAVLRFCLNRRRLKLWHDPRHNSLLAVAVRGRGRDLNAIFEDICDRYEAR